jgi:hypothetical protein
MTNGQGRDGSWPTVAVALIGLFSVPMAGLALNLGHLSKGSYGALTTLGSLMICGSLMRAFREPEVHERGGARRPVRVGEYCPPTIRPQRARRWEPHSEGHSGVRVLDPHELDAPDSLPPAA